MMTGQFVRGGDLRQIELLNALGQELVMSGGGGRYSHVAQSIRRTLKLAAATVWVFDKHHHVLVNEALDVDPAVVLGDSDLAFDAKLAHDRRSSLGSSSVEQRDADSPSPPDGYPYDYLSLPIFYRDLPRGRLNLYKVKGQAWYFEGSEAAQTDVFLHSLAGQLGVFVENRELELNTTFFKEIHHRVKNSLETVASLLRMQIRRLDRISAEQALEDSIGRVMTIALVHDTLTLGDIGMVDFSRLLTKISGLLTANLPSRPEISLTVAGGSPAIVAREATSLALVANELIQNALSHGLNQIEGGKIEISLHCGESEVVLTVSDNGHGLPDGFTAGHDDSLGITIINELVSRDLRGTFHLQNNPHGRGAVACVRYPRVKASPLQ